MPTEKQKRISEFLGPFYSYTKSMHDIWEAYSFIQFYMDEIHDKLKTNDIARYKYLSIRGGRTYKYKDHELYGIIDHIKKKNNPFKSLSLVVSVNEDFLQKITTQIYRHYPGRIRKDFVYNETTEERSKLFKVILDSEDKEEIIDRLIEEKVRGIFYGNPLHFFTKDKGNLGFGDYFKSNHSDALDIYRELLATRNVIIHNNGKIDRKYLSEFPNSTYSVGNAIKLDGDFIRDSIYAARGLSLVAAGIVLNRIYKADHLAKKYQQLIDSFKKRYP